MASSSSRNSHTRLQRTRVTAFMQVREVVAATASPRLTLAHSYPSVASLAFVVLQHTYDVLRSRWHRDASRVL